MKYLIIFVVTVLAIQFAVNHVNAMCMIDSDWPDKPCIDTAPPLPLSKSEWKDLWFEYYTFKGDDWMEQQKSELDNQIKSDTLKEWIESGYDTQNFTNYNVWFYYYVNDKAPAPEDYELDETNHESRILPPLKQFESGISIDEIKCKEGLEFVIKSSNDSPACVKPETKTKLIERGWTAVGQGAEQAISLIKNQYPQLQDFPSDDLPPKIIRAEKSSNGWYVIFETQGSGIPIIEAKCFLVDNSKSVIQIGQYNPEIGDMKTNISFKTCK